MIKKLKIAVLICLATCFFNLATTSLFSPVRAADQETFLEAMSNDLSDLTVVNGFEDLHDDLSDLTDPLEFFPCVGHTTRISTAINKLWTGTLWIKTWMWTQIR